ncbi:MAG: hypothetical protein RIC56_22615 [Pseudomonadales bacterium]
MVEWLFKYPVDVFRQGEVVFAPWFDGSGVLRVLALILLFGLLASVLVGARLRGLPLGRRLLIGAWQAAFVGVVLILLARPMLELSTLAPGANSVAVLVDVSASMGLPAGDAARSRLDAAVAALDEGLLPALSGLASVSTFSFAAAAERRAIDGLAADQPDTHLLGAVQQVLESFRGAPLAAVVVLTDGADTDVAAPDIALLANAGVPVHTVGVGPLALPGEVEIDDVALPARAPPDSRVVAQLTVRHAGAGEVLLKVRDGERLLAAETLTLAAGATAARHALSFDSGPGGIRELTFEIDAPAGDRLTQNNRMRRLLTVSDRRHRVLYLEGEPRWEYKFIRRALAGDDVIELNSWLRTTDRKTYRQDVSGADELSEGFPRSLEALYAYDVVVLGSLAATYLDDDAHRRLERFIGERGGSLIALAGRDALADGGWDVKPLADALPVRLERLDGGSYGSVRGRVRLTREGANSPVTQLLGGEGGDPWTTLPELADYQRLGGLKPAATTLLQVLIDDRPLPLLVVQPYGLGTSAVLATASTWRWRMATPADDNRHGLFWRQLLRQLAETAQPPRDLAVDVGGGAVEVRLTERDAAFVPRSDASARAEVTGPDRATRTIALTPTAAPGAFAARFVPDAPGVYRIDVTVDATAEPLTRFVRVGAENREYQHAVRNDALLRRLAAVTGGRSWAVEDATAIPAALRFSAAGVTQRERLPLWDMPALFLLLVLLKSGEWLLRRHWRRI